MSFYWGPDLPGDGRLLTRIPRPFAHIVDWFRARRRG